MKWEVLNAKYIFRNPPWLTIREDKLKSPDGHIKESYFVLEYPNWVNTIAITKDNKFVMVKQYRHALGKTSYELCAGVCDEEDVNHMESAQRELREETGYTGGAWSVWMHTSANPGTHTNLVFCYLAVGVEKTHEQMLDDSEYLTVHLLTYDQILQLLNENLIVQSLHSSALWKYVAQNGLNHK